PLARCGVRASTLAAGAERGGAPGTRCGCWRDPACCLCWMQLSRAATMGDVLSTTVMCSDCSAHRQDLESTGHHVVDCREDPTLPGYCVLHYTRPPALRGTPVSQMAAAQAQAAR